MIPSGLTGGNIFPIISLKIRVIQRFYKSEIFKHQNKFLPEVDKWDGDRKLQDL